ncbi:MAG: tetratricopeptide repeat protein [Syntrophorhabdaceae bacterium]|nr:tetratricopeptide repeat protein [Syntrophorhabdaceae bacterium]
MKNKTIKYCLVPFSIFVFLNISSIVPDPAYGQDRLKGPSSISQEEIPDWQARWELARVLSYVKRYDESIAEYNKLLKEKPALYEARAEMANVLFWQGKNAEALKALEQIPAADITGNTSVLMPDLYVIQKQYEKAETLYGEYLAKHPDEHKVRLRLAQTLGWDKKYDQSLAEYRTILQALPDDIQVRRKYAFGLIWAGKHAEAAAELKKTLR